MSLGSFFKSLLVGSSGTGQVKPSEPVTYKGLSIEAAPINADQNADLQSAIDHSISKAQQIIDEQGVSLLNKTHL
jgi:hypothetical protein